MQVYATKQRKALLDFLSAHADETLSAKDISLALSDKGISESAVYRNLISLEKDNAVQRLTVSGSKKIFYRYSMAKECMSHLHLSCVKCGKTMHVGEKLTNNFINRVIRESGFDIDVANSAIYGICRDCSR